MLRKFQLWLAAVAVIAGGVFVAPGAAQADDESEKPYCTRFTATGVGAAYGGGITQISGEWVAYTPQWNVSSSSACEDIQLADYPYKWYWRTRFYPSSGGSYANAWRSSCPLCLTIVATNVSNGTRFRIEGKNGDGGVWERGLNEVWF